MSQVAMLYFLLLQGETLLFLLYIGYQKGMDMDKSVILMVLPKIVLDAVQAEVGFYDFIGDLMFAGAAFAAFTLANMFFHNEIAKISQTFLYRRLNTLWEKKMLPGRESLKLRKQDN